MWGDSRSPGKVIAGVVQGTFLESLRICSGSWGLVISLTEEGERIRVPETGSTPSLSRMVNRRARSFAELTRPVPNGWLWYFPSGNTSSLGADWRAGGSKETKPPSGVFMER